MNPTIPRIDWPDDIHEVECVNFSQPLIYDLMVGINHERVTVISHTQNSWYHTYVFDYLGFRYELETEIEGGFMPVGEPEHQAPYRLSKIAKLDVDDDGETVVRPLTKPTMTTQTPSYDGVWGSF